MRIAFAAQARWSQGGGRRLGEAGMGTMDTMDPMDTMGPTDTTDTMDAGRQLLGVPFPD
jgi:hypothetical protein